MNTKRFFALTLALLMALLLLPPAPARAEDTYPLDVEVSPAGTGTVSGGGNYVPNSNFELKATPKEGWKFVEWRVLDGDVSVDRPHDARTTGRTGSDFTGGTIEAVFKKVYLLRVAISPSSVAGGVIGAGYYDPDVQVTLTAKAKPGWAFDHWECGSVDVDLGDSSANPTTVKLSSGFTGATVGAVFKRIKYPLDVVISPEGAGSVRHGAGTVGGGHAPGEIFTLIATANQGWAFDHWECDNSHVDLGNSSANPATVQLDAGYAGATVTAVFIKEATYPLTVKANFDERGTVTGGGDYAPNSDFELKATPNEGWKFVEWDVKEGDVSVDDRYNPQTTGRTGSGFTGGFIEASFRRIEAAVGIRAGEGGSVNSGDSGKTYAYGDLIPLKATPDEGWAFDYWEYDSGWLAVADPHAAETTASVLHAGRTSITAHFKKIPYAVTVTADPAEAGSVSGADSYTKGQTVTLTATPNEGWKFKEWVSDDVTVAEDGTFDMPARAVSVTAKFELIPYAVTVTADPAEGGTVSGAGSYTKGQTVTLTATPNEGWKFKEWVSDDVTVAEDGTFDMPAKAVAVKAVFEVKPEYTLVSGAAPSYRLKSGQTLTFTIKRNVDDENCFTYFEGVTLDGAALAAGTDYTAAPGSTVVTLKPAALDKLKTGDHTLIFSFTDGQAQTSVKIQAAYDDETGVGDNSHMFLWLAVALCGMMGLAALTVERKRLRQR